MATFALAPGLATADVINYNTIAGKALYKEATSSIYEEKEDKFDFKNISREIFKAKVSKKLLRKRIFLVFHIF